MQNLFSRLFGSTPASTQEENPVHATINRMLTQTNQLQEQGKWLEAKELHLQGIDFTRTHGESRAEHTFLSGLGMALIELEDYEQAEKYFREALNVANHLEDNALRAQSLTLIGDVYAAQKDWLNAQKSHEQGLDKARLSTDPTAIINSLESLSVDYTNQNNPSYGLHLLKEAVNLAQKSPHTFPLAASSLGKLGETALLTDEKNSARNHLEQALRLSQQTRRFKLAIRWQIDLAKLDLEEGRYQLAVQRFQQAQEMAHHIGFQSPKVFLEIASTLADIYIKTGNYDNALAEAERAYMHAVALTDEIAKAKAVGVMGLAYQGRQDFVKAREQIQDSLTYYRNGTLNDPDSYVQLLLAMGRIHEQAHELNEAKASYQEALQLAQNDNNINRQAEALQLIGLAQSANGENEVAITTWKEALQHFETVGEKASMARILCDIANARRTNGDFNGAVTDFETALQLLSSVDDRVTRGLVLSNAANIYTDMGDIETARSFYQEAIDIAETLQDGYAMSLRRGNMGWFHILQGNYDQGIAELEKAIAISHNLNDNLLIAVQKGNLGWAYYKKAELATATNLMKQANTIIDETMSPRWQGFIKANLACMLIDKDDMLTAEEMLTTAKTLSTQAQDQENLVRIDTRLAKIHMRTDRLASAEQLARDAESLARKITFRRGQATANRVLGDIYARRNETDNARKFYDEAQRLYQMLHDPRAIELKMPS